MVHNFGMYETGLFEGYEIMICIKYPFRFRTLASERCYIAVDVHTADCRNMINVSEHGF